MTSHAIGRVGGFIGLVTTLGLLLGAWWLLHEDAGTQIMDQEARMEPRPPVY